MSKYCPLAEEITNCTDNCKQCLEEEEKEELKMDNYKITLTIYPADAERIEVSYEGSDIYELKKHINATILSTMRTLNADDDLTRIEYVIEKNGEYFDSEEGYYRVDWVNGVPKFVID